jgi:rhomboid protease GluP
LIGSDETSCSWCGTKKTAIWWRIFNMTGGALAGDWLVRGIIITNVSFYILSLLFSSRAGLSLNPLSLLSPDRTSLLILGATGTIPIDVYGRGWTLLSANYLHGGIFHIIFNMMALRQIAPGVVQEFGAGRMFVIYTLGGICGYWVSFVAGIPFTIGASAAICGLIGALLYFGYSRGGSYGSIVFREVIGWIISLALFGLLMPGINNWGHGGGVAGGVILGMLLGYEERRPEKRWHHLLAVICALTTFAVLGWVLFGAVMLFFRY